mmetsp:Transcript_59152/g.163617  ORF Transcript_59152/g.163617 Transcript_59152/m.163617 type:complete len:209 (+) Transcript_59152:389-1015(+)
MAASFMPVPMKTTSCRLLSRMVGGHVERSCMDSCSQREPASILTETPACPHTSACCGELATQIMPFERRMPSEPLLCRSSMRAGWNGLFARNTKLEMLYSSVSGTWFPVSSWTHPGIFSASARSKLPVFSSSLGSTWPKVERTIVALAFSVLRIPSRRAASSASIRSVLFSTSRFAHSTWSTSRSGIALGSVSSAPRAGWSLSRFPSL